MKIKIIKNNLEDKIEEYQKQTGATKTWISNKIGISKQRLYSIFKAENMMVDVALKFAILLNCDIKDLFEYEIIEK